MSTELKTLADCALEVAKIAESLAGANQGKTMPKPVERLIVVAGALARIDTERPR